MRYLLIAALVMLAAVPAMAANGAWLQDKCDQPETMTQEQTENLAVCIGYVVGFHDSWMLTHSMNDTILDYPVPMVMWDEWYIRVMVVTDYLRAHPEAASKPAAMVVYLAWGEKWKLEWDTRRTLHERTMKENENGED